jgi:hypothetical protein
LNEHPLKTTRIRFEDLFAWLFYVTPTGDTVTIICSMSRLNPSRRGGAAKENEGSAQGDTSPMNA